MRNNTRSAKPYKRTTKKKGGYSPAKKPSAEVHIINKKGKPLCGYKRKKDEWLRTTFFSNCDCDACVLLDFAKKAKKAKKKPN